MRSELNYFTWKQVAHTLSEASAMLTCRIILQVKVDLVTWHLSHLYWPSPCIKVHHRNREKVQYSCTSFHGTV